MCPRVLRDNAELWEKWIYLFAKNAQLGVLGPYIPKANPVLSDIVYEMVLNFFLNHDAKGFLKLVQDWPPSIYSVQTIINTVEEKDRLGEISEANSALLVALGVLYKNDKQYDKALSLYLRLGQKHCGDGVVFDLITTHNLFDKIGDKVYELMKFNPEKAVTLLINNINRISVSRVIKQLPDEKMQLMYLDKLFFHSNKEHNQEGKEFHDLQVKLYAVHDKRPLYDFLEKSNYWDLEKALEICKKAELWREVVYILGRIGYLEEAIRLSVEKVGDVKEAISFVQKHNDSRLWDDLIQKSIGDPVFVSGLLDNLGTHINPLNLIEKIPTGMEIIGLRDRLVKIINDYLLHTSLSQGCNEVLKADVITLNKRMHTQSRRAIRIDPSTSSLISEQSIIGNAASRKRDVIAFFCNHTYFEDELVKHMLTAQGGPRPGMSPAALQQHQEALQQQLRSQDAYFCPVCRQNNENSKTQEKRKTRLRK